MRPRRSAPKNGIVATPGTSAREQVARARALDGEDAVVVADLLDRDLVSAPDEVLELGEVRFGGGQQELVGGRPQDDAVLDDEAAVVAPGRVLGVARRARPDVAGEDAGQERLGVADRGSGTCRAATSRRRRRRCGPRSTRTCPTSGSGCAARCPDQWLHSPVSLSALVRLWKGDVRIMRPATIASATSVAPRAASRRRTDQRPARMRAPGDGGGPPPGRRITARRVARPGSCRRPMAPIATCRSVVSQSSCWSPLPSPSFGWTWIAVPSGDHSSRQSSCVWNRTVRSGVTPSRATMTGSQARPGEPAGAVLRSMLMRRPSGDQPCSASYQTPSR